MTAKEETLLAIRLLQADLPIIDEAIKGRLAHNLDASDLIARRKAKMWKIEGLMELYKQEVKNETGKESSGGSTAED